MATIQAFIIVTSALCAAYFGLKLCAGAANARQKRHLTVLCLICLAFMFGIGGLISVRRISKSPRRSIRGVVANLRQSGGKSAHSYFDIQESDGRVVGLQMNYHGPRLQNGEVVAATYLDEYDSVLELVLDSGSTNQWAIEEGDGMKSSYCSLYAGAFLAMFAAVLSMMGTKTVRQ